MTDDTLRMSAVVNDRASGPLRQIARELGLVGKGADFSKLRSELAGLQGATSAVGREIRSMTVPALGALGLAGGGVVASLYGISRALRSVAESSLAVGHLGRETGFATSELKGFSHAAERALIAPESSQEALRTFSKNIFDIRRNVEGGIQGELYLKNAGDFVEKLKTARSNYEALQMTIARGEAIKRTQGEEASRRFFALVLGNGDFARLTADQIRQLVEEQRKLGDSSGAMAERAQKFHDQSLTLDQTLRKLKRTIGLELMPTLTPLLGELDTFLKQNQGQIGSAIADAMREIAQWTRDVNWKEVRETVGALAGFAKDIAGAAGSAGDFIRALRELRSYQVSPGIDIVPRMPQRLWDQRQRINEQKDQVREIDRRIGETEKESTAYKALAEQREKLIRELRNLEQGFEKLEREMNDAADKAKKMKFSNFGEGGGGAPLVVPASLATAGGGYGGFRAGGFRGGSFGVPGFGGGGAAEDGQALEGLRERLGLPKPGGGSTGGAGGAGAPTPRGMADKIAVAKRAMKEQLLSDGVSPERAEEAANLLAGQAIAESGLNPSTVHDQGTGYGIYGARLARRSAMFEWLKKNGYDRNSLEGQSRYMAHEAMTGRAYGPTRNALMNADPATRAQATNTITRNFEAPKFVNQRAGHVAEAARISAAHRAPTMMQNVRPSEGGYPGMFDPTRLRQMRSELSGGRIDAALRRESNPALSATGLLTVDVTAPRGTRVQAEGGGLFREVEMRRSMQMDENNRFESGEFGGVGSVPY